MVPCVRVRGGQRLLNLALLFVIVTCMFQVWIVWRLASISGRRNDPTPAFRTQQCAVERHSVAKGKDATYCFVFSTGRAATKHMSMLFETMPRPGPQTYVTHQEEDDVISTRDFVAKHYRRLAALENEADFNATVRLFVREAKLPFLDGLRSKHNADRVLYTGHLPLSFGLGPALIELLPERSICILRLRRDRIESALSLMALGPETEDPWSDRARSRKLRWFPVPWASFARLRIARADFDSLNRFQKWLWYVDEIECRWQALVRDMGHRFHWMEATLEGLNVMDGGRGWSEIATFLGVQVRRDALGARDNSIQAKGREKLVASEHELRAWDAEYKRVSPACDLAGDGSVFLRWS